MFRTSYERLISLRLTGSGLERQRSKLRSETGEKSALLGSFWPYVSLGPAIRLGNLTQLYKMGCQCLREKEPLSLPSKEHHSHREKTAKGSTPSHHNASSQSQTDGKAPTPRKLQLALPDGQKETVRSSDSTPARTPFSRSQTTPRNLAERRKEVRLSDVRVLSVGLESYYKVKAGENGGMIGAEVKETRKKCWMRVYAVSTNRKIREKRAKLAARMRQLDHPNVLRVLDILQSQDQQFVVYEATAGGTAQELSKRMGGLNERWAATIMRQVFLAVAHCQSKGIVLGSLTLSQITFAEPPTEQCTWAKLLVSLEDKLDIASPSDSPDVQEKLFLTHTDAMHCCGEVLSNLLTGENVLVSRQKSALSEEFKSNYMKWQSVSQEVKTFALSLLSKDPAKRPTLQDCLHHPWIAEARCKTVLSPCLRTALRNMAAARPISSLKKTLLQLIFNFVLPYDDLKEARKAFMQLGSETDGSISESELRGQIFRLYPEEQAQAAFTAITQTVVFSEQRSISYSEFLLWACGPLLLTPANITSAFHLLDIFSDGKVTSKHLRDFFTLESEDPSDTLAWRTLINSVSSTMDGTFHYKDFCAFLKTNS